MIFHAMCVLEDEARRATKKGAIKPTPALRLAVAFLYGVSRDDGECDPLYAHRLFWAELTQRSETDTRSAEGFGRWQTLNSCLNGIARAAGMPRDHEYDAARDRLRKKGRI